MGVHKTQLRPENKTVLPQVEELVLFVFAEGEPDGQRSTYNGIVRMRSAVRLECLTRNRSRVYVPEL
jgi:hypothetical protein